MYQECNWQKKYFHIGEPRYLRDKLSDFMTVIGADTRYRPPIMQTYVIWTQTHEENGPTSGLMDGAC